MLCFAATGSYGQTADIEAAKREEIHNRAKAIYRATNGNMPGTQMHYKTNYSNVHALYPDAPANAVPAYPGGSYVALQTIPCYKYKGGGGREIMACPGAQFTDGSYTEITGGDNIELRTEKSFTGNYPTLHGIYPDAPANAVPAWPSSPYKELKNPPCYKYINKRGLEVTECPGAQFEPEHIYR